MFLFSEDCRTERSVAPDRKQSEKDRQKTEADKNIRGVGSGKGQGILNAGH